MPKTFSYSVSMQGHESVSGEVQENSKLLAQVAALEDFLRVNDLEESSAKSSVFSLIKFYAPKVIQITK